MVRAMPLVRDRVPAAQWLVVGDGSLRRDIEAWRRAGSERRGPPVSARSATRNATGAEPRARVWIPSRVPANSGGDGFGSATWRRLSRTAGDCRPQRRSLDAVIEGTMGLLVDRPNSTKSAIHEPSADRSVGGHSNGSGGQRACPRVCLTQVRQPGRGAHHRHGVPGMRVLYVTTRAWLAGRAVAVEPLDALPRTSRFGLPARRGRCRARGAPGIGALSIASRSAA